MVSKTWTAAALSLALSGAAFAEGAREQSLDDAHAQLQETTFLDLLVPPGTVIEHQGFIVESTRAMAKASVVRTEVAEIGLAGIALSSLSDGGYVLAIDKATVMPRIPDAPRVSVTDLALVLNQMPAAPGSHCSWLDAISGWTADRIQIDRGIEEVEQVTFHAGQVAFQSLRRGDCSLGGRITLGSATTRQPSGATHRAVDVRIDAWLPGSADAAASLAGPASIAMAVGELEIGGGGQIPGLGASDLTLSLSAEMASLAAPLQLVGAANPYRYVWPGNALAMQGYNAALRASFDLAIETKSLRIYSAGVMPAAMIRNFSRAGLSTITGSMRLDLAMRRGLARLRQDLAMTGLGDQSLMIEASATPYDMPLIEATMGGQEIGLDGVPDIVIHAAQLDLEDRGFSAAAREITGYALASTLADPQQLYDMFPELNDDTVSELSQRLRSFATYLASGEAVTLAYKPLTEINIIALLAGLANDPIHLPIAVNP